MVVSRRKRATDQPDSPGIDNKKLKTLDNKSSVGDSDTDDSLQGLGKEEKKKKRKARNQRKYYQRHRARDTCDLTTTTSLSSLLDPISIEQDLNGGDPIDEASNNNLAIISITDGPKDNNSDNDSDDNSSGSEKDSSSILTKESSPTIPPLPCTTIASTTTAENVRTCLASIRRHLLELERDWGAIDQWPNKFLRDWQSIRVGGHGAIWDWFESVKQFVDRCREVFWSVESVMEAELPSNPSEFKDIWLEAYQLVLLILNGVLGLEHRLHFAIATYQPSHI